jgi:hypothetical protein
MSLASALQADRDGRIEAAADLYEAALSEEPTSLVALINLAVLYWRATEYRLFGPARKGHPASLAGIFAPAGGPGRSRR